MEHEILDLIDRYWKFDDNQQPVSNWHDKQDLLDEVHKTLQNLNVLEKKREFPEELCRLNENYVCICSDKTKCSIFEDV
jgi:hypothetical protein